MAKKYGIRCERMADGIIGIHEFSWVKGEGKKILLFDDKAEAEKKCEDAKIIMKGATATLRYWVLEYPE